jgi:nucleotide-binding universal stress UspA family protein
MTRAIVVGIDGSTESRHAMEWAFDESRRSEHPLHLLYAASDDVYSPLTDTLMQDLLAEDARRVVEQTKQQVPADLADSTLVEWVFGTPAKVLVHASEEAHMLVVGTHGRSLVGAALRGSVSRHVTRHAKSPVVVVRPAEAAGRVVAGLDLDAPEPLLPAAFHQAAVRGLPLTVVRAWMAPGNVGVGMGVPMAGLDPDNIERGERGMAEQLVTEWAAKYPDVAVDLRLVRGDARHVLVDASEEAELLVVGPHGRGWFSGLTLGSTSETVAEHAHSPVLVAR